MTTSIRGLPEGHIRLSRAKFSHLVRVIAAISALAASAWASAPSTSAHAALDQSDPSANSVLAAAPSQITLSFTEPLERSYSRATLFDQIGQPVPGGDSQLGQADKDLIITPTSPLADGTYSVVWQTLSNADGHTAEGYFAFTVGSHADVATVVPPSVASNGEVPLWLRSAARWIAFMGLAAGVAVWPIWLLVVRPAVGSIWDAGPRLARRVRRLAYWALAFGWMSNIVVLLVQASSLPSGSFRQRALDTITDTRFGQLWLWRIALLGAFTVVLVEVDWWRPARHRWSSTAALGLAASLPFPVSLNAHASALELGRNTGIAFDYVHLLAACVWAGGLLVLTVCLLPTLRELTHSGQRSLLGQALPRFSLVAISAWILLGFTGAYSAWLHVGNLEALRNTAYGSSLVMKLLLLVPVLALAAFNLLIVTRKVRSRENEQDRANWGTRFGFAVAIELALAVAVLLLVGRLTAQQPARDVLAAKPAGIELNMQLNNRTGTLTVSPASVGPNHYVLTMDGSALPETTEAVLRLTMADRDMGQEEVQLERSATNRFEMHGSELSIAGDWTIQVIVRNIGEFQFTGSEQVSIATTPPTASGPRPAWRFGTSGLVGFIAVVVGICAVCFAGFTHARSLRRLSAGLGTIAVLAGLLLLLNGRVEPTSDAQESTDHFPAPTGSVVLRETIRARRVAA